MNKKTKIVTWVIWTPILFAFAIVVHLLADPIYDVIKAWRKNVFGIKPESEELQEKINEMIESFKK